jgi:hypothetical protein
MIKILLKLTIFIFIIEIVIGYLSHMHSIKKYTDFYSSSLARFVNFKLENYQISKLEENLLNENKKIIKDDDTKLDQKCFGKNNNINTIVDFQENRIDRNIRLQTSYENFFNKNNFDDNIIILLSGSSELYGRDHKIKIHKILQDNLNDFFKTNKIIVINSSNFSSFISDEIRDVQVLIKKYPLDIVISYAGANDIKYLSNFYLGRFNEKKFLNTNLNSWVRFIEDDEIKKYCLNNNYYTKENYLRYMNREKILKNNYNKLLEIFKENQLNYLIFLQPFETDNLIENSKKNFEILKNFELKNDNFTNMNEYDIFSTLNLTFVDETHTKSSHRISDYIQKKIIEKYKEQIERKL